MECVVCGRQSGYNRAVVDTTADRELGGLCVRCELRKLGELADQLGSDDQSCAYCTRDGLWALPKYLPSTYREDGRTVSYVDYEVGADTLRVCDEHLSALGVADLPVTDDRPIAATGDRE
ncbi:hypothetical protein [Halobacterium yunchengense]|uniref:hypothetical protein n=1 Tax=Halobacterium yunchengense TaxID=3108497 RepID=UPI00300988A5